MPRLGRLPGFLDGWASNDGRVLLNSAAGFSLGFSLETPLGFSTLALAVSDVNSDGRADLLVINPGANKVVLLLGTDFGDFLPPNAYTVPAPGP